MVTIKNRQNLRKNLNKFIALVVCVFAFTGAANDAHALDFGCRDKEQIKAELMAENQVPVVRFYVDGSSTKVSKFQETFFTMNPQTREGYRMDRGYDALNGQMCITGKFTDIRLYNPQTLDQRAYLDAADADKKGTGINNIIYGRSQVYGDNPIFRASEYSPIHQSTRITYVTSNPLKGNEGQVIASSLDGVYDKKFTKKIPNKQSGYANVDHGAIFTESGKIIADQQAGKPAAQ